MKDNTRIYDLLVSNNVPEKLFISQYGQELFDKLKNEAYAIDMGKCAGCGHEPPEQIKKECLSFHIYEINKERPELSKGITLCKMCHSTQHIESAIKHKWVLLVNSIYSQNTLIKMTRPMGGVQIYDAVNRREIINLKKTPEQFLKEWYDGEIKFSPTLKVIFTNNFSIEDL